MPILINSLIPSDLYMRLWTRPSSIQIMACRRVSANHYLNQCWVIGPSGRNVCEILIEIYTFLFKKMHLKMIQVWLSACLVQRPDPNQNWLFKSKPKMKKIDKNVSTKIIWKCHLQNVGHFVLDRQLTSWKIHMWTDKNNGNDYES